MLTFVFSFVPSKWKRFNCTTTNSGPKSIFLNSIEGVSLLTAVAPISRHGQSTIRDSRHDGDGEAVLTVV